MPRLAPSCGRRARSRLGISLPEVAAACAATSLLAALALPALGAARNGSLTHSSLSNLRTLGAANVSYAWDWNERQWTAMNDTLSAYGSNAGSAFQAYNSIGLPFDLAHPPITLGWGRFNGDGQYVHFAYRTQIGIANQRLCEPIVFDGPNFATNGRFGSFRFINDGRFTPYVSGRFYGPGFHAPSDTIVEPIVQPLRANPDQYVDSPPLPGFGDIPYWSSYIRSAAAMFDPEVMAARVDAPGGATGGWVDPWSIDHGMRSPSFWHARYPHLKTDIIEHHWLQNAPDDPCNPAFGDGGTYGGCEPYYFNHGLASAPGTVFYDGSVRLLPNAEVVAADALVQEASGGAGFDGLWSRSTALGEDGYFADLSLDGTRTSHHVLTADGILGRDTLGTGDFGAPNGLRRGRSKPPARGSAGTAPLVPNPASIFQSQPDPGPHRR